MSEDNDRLKREVTLFIKKVLGLFIVPSIDYLAAYPCKVITQNSDGTLELSPDDSRLPPSYSHVPIRYGIPGITVQVANGGRALLQFTGGDPTKQYCTIWETSTVTSFVVANGSNGAARTNDLVGKDTTMAAWITSVTAQLNVAGPVAGANGALVAPTDFGKITGGSSIVKVG